mmetsp:Transcript_66379/g.117865  ORF Transcript_66379/g.117865 Transcript_66379/m.117865 type:complete len:101 (-) Transcript_66379:92-394(-)
MRVVLKTDPNAIISHSSFQQRAAKAFSQTCFCELVTVDSASNSVQPSGSQSNPTATTSCSRLLPESSCSGPAHFTAHAASFLTDCQLATIRMYTNFFLPQ